MKKIFLSVFAILVLFQAKAFAYSIADYDDLHEGRSAVDDCVVNSSTWEKAPSDRRKLTLLRAMYHATTTEDVLKACQNKITLAEDVNAEGPLPIFRSGPWTLDGGADADGKPAHTINFSHIEDPGSIGERVKNTPEAQAPGGRLCAVSIEGSNMTVQNLVLDNIPNGWNGLCIYGEGNQVKNVQVNMTGRDSSGTAIVFVGQNSTIDLKTKVTLTGDAIGVQFDEDSSGGFSTNELQFGALPAVQEEVLDLPSGVVKVGANVEGFRVSGSDPAKFFSNINNSYSIIRDHARLVPNADPSKSYFEFAGWIVNTEGGVDKCASPAVSNATAIQIYGSNKVGLYGAIVPKGAAGFGITTVSGYFSFRLPQAVGFSSFALIPQFGDNQLGTPSEVYDLSNRLEPECPNRASILQGQGIQNPGGNDQVVSQFVTGLVGVVDGFTREQCKRAFEIGTAYPEGNLSGKDSDGDSLRDVEEDKDPNDINSNGVTDEPNCVQDEGETDSFVADTDHDGLYDGVDFEEQCGLAACGPGNNAKLNGTNPDVDNDGLLDGEEDRSFYYTIYRKQNNTREASGYLYFIGSGQYDGTPVTYPVTVNDVVTSQVKTCTLDASDTKVGVSYQRYDLLLNSTTGRVVVEPIKHETADMLAPSEVQGSDGKVALQGTVLLACRSEILRSDTTSFNGKFDRDALETNLSKDDSEGEVGDGVKDGLDACPTLVGTEAFRGCPGKGKVADCTDNLVYFGVSRQFLQISPDNFNPIGLLDEDLNNIADVLEPTHLFAKGVITAEQQNDPKAIHDAIQRMAFGDLDQDLIPDVVESQSAKEQGSDSGLSFCDRDSDDDGLIDGPGINGAQSGEISDVCPASNGGDANLDVAPVVVSQKDQYSDDVNHLYSCETLKVYSKSDYVKPLAYFLDRDNDELMDAQEDVKLDGVIYKPQIRNARVSKELQLELVKQGKGLESHPLLRDTDGDGLDDHFEWTTEISQSTDAQGKTFSHFTNPGDLDSDGDGMNDDIEINRDHNPEIHIEINKSNGGCESTFLKDTDPTNNDTDFDGLLDGSEATGIPYDTGDAEHLADLLKQPDFFTGNEEGRRLYSSPVDENSDGDSLTDAEEYNIEYVEGAPAQTAPALTRFMTSPCHSNTDGDDWDDDAESEAGQCGTVGGDNAEFCVPDEDVLAPTAKDFDGDGISDVREGILGTDPNNPDSDGDGLYDGQEDCNHDGRIAGICAETGFLESNPLAGDGVDTDKDGLNDYQEVYFGQGSGGSSVVVVGAEGQLTATDPTNPDSDGDGIPDGPGGLVAGPNGEPVQSLGEDANGNGRYDTGETDPRNPDTDGDGLADGLIGGLGEDFNRNGIVDKDAKGRLLETDPRVPDTDFDGRPDGDEAMRNGRFSISRATNYNDGGCSLVTNGQGSMPVAVSFFFGLVMLATTTVRRKVKNAVSKAA